MTKHASPARWYAPWRLPAHPASDPADLGTAFGLDLSLQAPPVALPRPADPRAGNWMQRWAARRRPTV